MKQKFIYMTNGNYLGFTSGDNLFSRDGLYLGWLEGDNVWDKQGNYRGSVVTIGNASYILKHKFSINPIPRVPRVPSVSPVPPLMHNIMPIVVPLAFEDGFQSYR